MEELRIEQACIEDADEIFELYHSLLDDPFGTWNEEYPSRELVQEDLQNSQVYVMKNEEGHIVSAIVNEKSEEFDELAHWYSDIQNWAQLGRLGVARDMQGKGIARLMLSHAMHEAKLQGCEAVRFLVSAGNLPAQRSYAKLNFEVCGEADAWGGHWLCYEKRL